MLAAGNLYFMFLIGNMLTDYGIILLNLKFTRHIGLVRCGCVEMAGFRG